MAAAKASIASGFAMALSYAAMAAEPPPVEFRVTGSLPLQYTEVLTRGAERNSVSAAPYLAGSARLELAPDLTTAIYARGGHSPPGAFRDFEGTLAAFGGDMVRRWGAFSAGTRFEHAIYYAGTFDSPSNIVNDAELFAQYRLLPNRDLQVTLDVSTTGRFDDAFAMQRMSYSFRMEIEQRLFDAWWLVARPRLRYSNYVGAEAGRRDVTASITSGLKYEFTRNVSFVMVAGYENRASNVASRDRDRFVAGASFDFNFTVEPPRRR
jgi:hypothetical protein